MKVTNRSSYSVVEKSVKLSVQEMRILLTVWENLKEQVEQKLGEDHIIEEIDEIGHFDVFFGKFTNDITSDDEAFSNVFEEDIEEVNKEVEV